MVGRYSDALGVSLARLLGEFSTTGSNKSPSPPLIPPAEILRKPADFRHFRAKLTMRQTVVKGVVEYSVV